MPTLRADPSFRTKIFVFGKTTPGCARWGEYHHYPQNALWGTRAVGGQIPGLLQTEAMLPFVYGLQNEGPQSRYAITPFMCIRAWGKWANKVLFYTIKNQQRIRHYTAYDHSCKNQLVENEEKLKTAAEYWRNMTDDKKSKLIDHTKRNRSCHCAWNFFTKLFMTDNPAWRNYV